MDFFQHQDAALQRSKRLVFLFIFAVIAIVLSIYMIALLVYNLKNGTLGTSGHTQMNWWHKEIFAWSAGSTLALILMGSLNKFFKLRKGGRAVAEMLGGKEVLPNTADNKERQLFNIVEEMSIASGLPVPSVYLMKEEQGINAFAAGNSPSDAAVAVTNGTLNLLTRDELQGVIAHEFSHILNGDMRINIRLISLLNGILLLGITGSWLLRSMHFSGRRRGNAQSALAIMFVGLSLFIIGYIGVFFGNIIKAGISRQREYLADASAVQFTRNPSGISNALKKIGGFMSGSEVSNKHAEEASHMFFGSIFLKPRFFSGLYATHPPLEKRIKAIEPTFNGTFPAVQPSEPVAIEGVAISGLSSSMGMPQQVKVTPGQMVSSIGEVRPEHVSYGAQLMGNFSEELIEAIHESTGAKAVIYSLLLDSEQSVKDRQLQFLEDTVNESIFELTLKLSEQVVQLGPAARLPLLDLSLPALRQLPLERYLAFEQNIKTLVATDEQVTLFEYVLLHALTRHLTATHGKSAPKPIVRHHSPQSLFSEIQLVLSLLAHCGHQSDSDANRSYMVGMQKIKLKRSIPPMLSRDFCDLQLFDQALDKMQVANPGTKRRILNGCAFCVAADNIVTQEEAELIRAISDSLDCPMPPFLP